LPIADWVEGVGVGFVLRRRAGMAWIGALWQCLAWSVGSFCAGARLRCEAGRDFWGENRAGSILGNFGESNGRMKAKDEG